MSPGPVYPSSLATVGRDTTGVGLEGVATTAIGSGAAAVVVEAPVFNGEFSSAVIAKNVGATSLSKLSIARV